MPDGDRTNIVQHYRTIVSNNPPAASVLLEGEIGIEMADPMKLWIGVPPALDPTGRKLLFDRSQNAWLEAPTDGQLYGRNGSLAVWQPALPLTGGTLSGGLGIGGQGITFPALGAAAANFAFAWSSNSIYAFVNGTAYGPLLTQTQSDGRYLQLSGGTLTGPLVLAGDATAPLQATTLQQVQAAIAAIPLGNYLPLAGGTLTGGLHFGNAVAPGGVTDLSRHIDLFQGTFGFSITSARMNLVAPSGGNLYVNVAATDVLQVNNSMIRPYVGVSFNAVLAASAGDLTKHIDLFGGQYGFNMTTGHLNAVVANMFAVVDYASGTRCWQAGLGGITAYVTMTLAADPTQPLQAATKQYVDNNAGAVTVSDAAPSSPRPGSLWWDSLGGNLYLYYQDPNSSQWVVANASAGGLPDAPTDGAVYGRSNAAWAKALPLAGGTLTGALTLAADPTVALGAATKQYVDAVNARFANYLPLAGGTITGSLTVSVNLGVSGIAQFSAGFSTAGGLGNINNVNNVNYLPAQGFVTECSNPPLWVNKIGGNGTAVAIMQGSQSCGSITVANATTTAFNTSSDARLKQNAQGFDPGPILDATETWYFEWTTAPGVWAYGVIAQDAANVFPDAVHHDGDADSWGVDYSKYVPLLLAEVKALRARVAGLEAGAR